MAETLADYMELTSVALREMAADASVLGRSSMNKEELARALFARAKAVAAAAAPPPTPTPTTKAIKKSADTAVTAAVADIRSALRAGVKIAQIANPDPDFADAVLAVLRPAERRCVCFGNPAANAVR